MRPQQRQTLPTPRTLGELFVITVCDDSRPAEGDDLDAFDESERDDTARRSSASTLTTDECQSSNESPSDRPKLVPIWRRLRTVKATLVAMAVHR